MSLPTTAPRIYTVGMPAIPDDINELFAQHTDDKYASRAVPLHAGGWQKISGAAAYASGKWTGAGVLVKEIALPVGARLSKISLGYNRGGAGSVAIDLERTTLANGGTTPPNRVLRSLTDNTGAAQEVLVITDLNLDSVDDLNVAGALPPGEIIAVGKLYTISVTLPASGEFSGGVIESDKL